MKYIFMFFISILFITLSFAQDINKMTRAELDSIVMVYYGERRFEEALPYAEKSVEKARIQGMDSSYAYALNDLASIYADMGDFKKSEKLYLESRDIRKNLLGEMHPDYAYSLNNLGILYMDMLQYEKAEQVLLESKKIRKKVLGEDHPDYAHSLNNLATLYLTIANLEAAEPLLLETQKNRKKILGEENPDYAVSLNNLAMLYVDMQKYELAEQFFLQAGAIWKKTLGENHRFYTTYLLNLAHLYTQMGQHEKAEKLYYQNLGIIENIFGKKHENYAMALNNLAHLYLKIKNYTEAETFFIKSLEILGKTLGKNHNNYATVLSNLSSIYSNTKDYLKAEKMLLEAIEIERNILGEKHPNFLRTLCNLAMVYMYKKDYDLALKTIYDVLLKNCKNKDLDSTQLMANIALLVDNEFYSDIRLTIALEAMYKIRKAQYVDSQDKRYLEDSYLVLNTAMQINEKIRNGLNTDEDKLRTLREMQGLIKSAIATTCLLANEDDKYTTKNAFKFAEQNKSILLADALKGQRAHILGDLPDSLALFELELYDKKKKLERNLILAKNEDETIKLRSKQGALNLEIETFKTTLQQKYPKYYQLKYANVTAKVEDVQKKLNDKSLFLEYFIADTVVYLFAIRKNDFQLILLDITNSELKQKIAVLRDILSNYVFLKNKETDAYQIYTKSAYWFFDKLVAPALKNNEQKAESLIIIADGELGHLPFEAFLTKQAPQEKTSYGELSYLVKDYNLSYNYSATLFANIGLDKKAKSTSKKGQILALAASYGDSIINNTRTEYIQNLRKNLQPLPAAQEEVAVLSENFNGTFYLGNDANEAKFKTEAGQYSIIHLAMHGIINPRTPILSSLAFSENHQLEDDNFLEAWEIARLQLNADLVVLSACETGYGKFEQGEGVLSLARSFMYASTPSLIVSLWQVNDYSTAAIMQYFYENLAKGMPKHEALRQAKLSYLNRAEGIAAHPAFWSPFILIGDETAVQISKKTNYIWWGIAGLGALALGGGLFAFRKKQF